MYGIAGERRLTEFELAWLPGYEGSKPVRVGNAASGQFQLDVYGEVLDAHLLGHGRWAMARTRRRLGAGEGPDRFHLETPGSSPTTASGRCAAAAGTSPTRR